MLVDRPSRLIYLPLLLSAAAVFFLAALTWRSLERHRVAIGERLRTGLNQQIAQTVERLRLRESQRHPRDFLPADDGIAAPGGHGGRDPLVRTYVTLGPTGVLAPEEGAAPGADAAVAWCAEHAAALRHLMRDLTPADLDRIGGGAESWLVSPFRLALGPEATPLIWRAARQAESPDDAPWLVQIVILDREALKALGEATADRLAPAVTARWLRHPERPVAFAFDLPEEVVEANSFTGGYFQALLAAVAFCVLSIVAGLLVLRRQRRRLIREQDFTSAVSHELKTPVAAMQALVGNLVEGRVTSPERQAEYHRIIAREADRLGRLVDNVLWQARLEQGRLRIRPVPNQLNQACCEVADRLAGDLEVHLDLDELADVVAVDQEAIRRVLVNLLDNARKYAPGSPVWIETRQEGGHARLRVSDRGPGIPDADRSGVLKAWGRTGSHAHQPGLGLGLSLVSTLVAAHGGRITLADNEPQGLVVEIRLPLALDRYLIG